MGGIEHDHEHEHEHEGMPEIKPLWCLAGSLRASSEGFAGESRRVVFRRGTAFQAVIPAAGLV